MVLFSPGPDLMQQKKSNNLFNPVEANQNSLTSKLIILNNLFMPYAVLKYAFLKKKMVFHNDRHFLGRCAF